MDEPTRFDYPDDFVFASCADADRMLRLKAHTVTGWVHQGKISPLTDLRPNGFMGFLPRRIRMGDLRPLVEAYHPRTKRGNDAQSESQPEPMARKTIRERMRERHAP